MRHVWSLPRLGTFLCILAPVDPAASSFPSIAARHPAANWFEREVMDYFGVVPRDHPNPERVAVHDDWPEGAWALRKDFDADTQVPRVDGNFIRFDRSPAKVCSRFLWGPFTRASSSRVISASAAGEPVLYLQLRLFYVHKGTEKRFERLPWPHTLFLAESISGDTAVLRALLQITPSSAWLASTPARAQVLRVVLLELERLQPHRRYRCTRHRCRLHRAGESRADPTRRSRAPVRTSVRNATTPRHHRVRQCQTRSDTGRKRCPAPPSAHAGEGVRQPDHVVDRFRSLRIALTPPGILSNQVARDLGIVGMAARASGIDADLRRDHPHDAHAEAAVRGSG